MKFKYILPFFIGLFFATHSHADFKDFLGRGRAHCTGYCDKGNLKCVGGVNKQGYYDWCKMNCLHSNKTNLKAFQDAISACEKVLPNYPYVRNYDINKNRNQQAEIAPSNTMRDTVNFK